MFFYLFFILFIIYFSMKNKFIKSTIILIIGGLITKILGMIIKISLTRTINTEGISLYMLVLPTFNLFISLCNLGVPTAISKLVSERKKRSKQIILPVTLFILLYNIFLIFLLFLIAPFLSTYLLHNKDVYFPTLAIGFTLPFIAISSIIKGYFYGKEKVFPCTISNITEQIVRLILTILIIPKIINYGLPFAVSTVILVNIVSEFSSIIVLLIYLPKEKIYLQDFQKDASIQRDIWNISLPTTASRMISSITYFFEPIILTNTLSYVGYSSSYITLEYGIINGYVFPLLLLPSFFTMAISSSLLPIVSNGYANKKYAYTKSKIKVAILLSLLIGIPITLIFIFIPDIPLKLVYNTTLGREYIRFCAPIFILHYIQAPLTSSLSGMGYAKEAMKGTIYGSIVRILALFIFGLMGFGIWALIIASSLNIIIVTIHHIYYTVKYLKGN